MDETFLNQAALKVHFFNFESRAEFNEWQRIKKIQKLF